jgi:hypothetical protein
VAFEPDVGRIEYTYAMPKIPDAVLLFFAPEHWGEVERFSNLCSETYKFDEREKRAVSGVRQHFDKACTFRRLARQLTPGLRLDRDQLNTHGFTPAERSQEVAAVIEAALVELYSCVDCTVKVLRAIYGRRTKGFKDSTRALFRNVDAITGDFPDALREAIRSATWFGRLLFLRDELTHLGTGSCRLPHDSDTARYLHLGIKEHGKPLEIEDIFGWLDLLFDQINLFLGQVFGFLRGTLSDAPVNQICGMVQGRMLVRRVVPTQPLDSSSGICMSWIWFEKLDAPTCPFVAHCGAYARTRGGAAATAGGADAVSASTK